MSQKIEFVEKASKAGANISALCREYAISRQTGHKWLERYRASGYDGLEERSRRPLNAPSATGEELILAIIEVREDHPTWGPKKIEIVLRRKHGEQTPSRTTIARILERFGRVQQRHKQRAKSVVESAPQVQATKSNEVWSVDFKGWWKNTKGERCEPLTVRDAHSRFVLLAQMLGGTKLEPVQKEFIKLFKRHGIPQAIQCDNGTPFIAVRARGGLTRLSAWWVSLGIRVVRSRPGCPQDNGAHERMHRDLSQEVEAFPQLSRQAAQRAMDRWRQVFNHERPHEALAGKVPADVYKSRPLKAITTRKFEYPTGWRTVMVRKHGRVRLNGVTLEICEALAGHFVGLQQENGLSVRLWFHDHDLGCIEVVPNEHELERQLENLVIKKANRKIRPTLSKRQKSNAKIEVSTKRIRARIASATRAA